MKTQLNPVDFVEYQNRLRLHLAKYLEEDSIKLEELMAILNLLSGSENLDEFKSLVGIFAKSFPVLKEFLDIENEEVYKNKEKDVYKETKDKLKGRKK